MQHLVVAGTGVERKQALLVLMRHEKHAYAQHDWMNIHQLGRDT